MNLKVGMYLLSRFYKGVSIFKITDIKNNIVYYEYIKQSSKFLQMAHWNKCGCMELKIINNRIQRNQIEILSKLKTLLLLGDKFENNT